VKRALFAPVGEKLLVKRHEAVTKLSRSSLRDGGQAVGEAGARRVASGRGARLQAGVVDARDERGGEQRRVERLGTLHNNEASFVTPRGAASLRAPPETAVAPRGGRLLSLAAASRSHRREAPTPATRSGSQARRAARGASGGADAGTPRAWTGSAGRGRAARQRAPPNLKGRGVSNLVRGEGRGTST